MPRGSLAWRLRRNRSYQTLFATVRDTLLLLREFFVPLLLLIIAAIAGGVSYAWLSWLAGEDSSLAEALFTVFSMMFLQANVDFPDEWYRQIYFFVMPIVGLIILAQGAADFGTLLFNRKARGGAWQAAMAAIFSNHVVLVGLGHVGMRVAAELHNQGEEVVVIELDSHNEHLPTVIGLGFPVLSEDATKPATLAKAGIDRARAAVVCTSNDILNLQIALKMKDLNPDVRVIVRVFDGDFANSLQQHFAFDYAFSASSLAAPAVVAAALELDVVAPITLAGRVLNLSRYTVRPATTLAQMTIGEFERHYDVSIVLLDRNGLVDLHPPDDTPLMVGDLLAVFGDRDALEKIARDNRDKTSAKK